MRELQLMFVCLLAFVTVCVCVCVCVRVCYPAEFSEGKHGNILHLLAQKQVL